MSTRALAAAIDGFNQRNDPFAIGMNFVVAGIGSMQELIKHVEAETFDPKQHAALLETAEQMLAFGAERLRGETKERALLGFIERYRGLAAELRALVAGASS